jgi:hypothetical protein
VALEDDNEDVVGTQDESVQAPEVNPRERIGRAHGTDAASVGQRDIYALPEGFVEDTPKIGPKGKSVLDRVGARYNNKFGMPELGSENRDHKYALPEGFVEDTTPDVKQAKQDDGFHIGGPMAAIHGLEAGVPKAVGSTLKALGELFGGDNALTKAGEGINEWTDKNVGFTPEEQNTVLGAAGSGLAPIVAAVLGAPLVAGALAATPEVAAAGAGAAVLGTFGVLGAAGGINAQADKARAAGEDTSTGANIVGGLVGGAEGLAMGSVGKILAPFAKAAPLAAGWLKEVVLPKALEASAFGGLAVADDYVQHEIHKQMVDPDAEFHPDFTSAAGQAVIGAILGGRGQHKLPGDTKPGDGVDSKGTGTPAKGDADAKAAQDTATPHIDQMSNSVGTAAERAKPDTSARAKENVGNGLGEADSGNDGRFAKKPGQDRFADDWESPDAKTPLDEEAGAPMQAGLDPTIKAAIDAEQPAKPEVSTPAPETAAPVEKPAETAPPEQPAQRGIVQEEGAAPTPPVGAEEVPSNIRSMPTQPELPPNPQAPAPPAAEAAKATSRRRSKVPKLGTPEVGAAEPAAAAAPAAPDPARLATIREMGRQGKSLTDIRKVVGEILPGDNTARAEGYAERNNEQLARKPEPVTVTEGPISEPTQEVKPAVAEPVTGMPSQITNKMKSQLRARGHTPEEIFNMTPGQAHEILAKPAVKQTADTRTYGPTATVEPVQVMPKAARAKKVSKAKDAPAQEPVAEKPIQQAQQEQPKASVETKAKPYVSPDLSENASHGEIRDAIRNLREGKQDATNRGDKLQESTHQLYIDELNKLLSPKVSDADRLTAAKIVRDAYTRRSAPEPKAEPEARRRGQKRDAETKAEPAIKQVEEAAPAERAPPRQFSGGEQEAKHNKNLRAVKTAFEDPRAAIPEVPKGTGTGAKLNRWIDGVRGQIRDVLNQDEVKNNHDRSPPSKQNPEGKLYYPTAHPTPEFKWVQLAHRFVNKKMSFAEFMMHDKGLRSGDESRVQAVYDEVKDQGNNARKVVSAGESGIAGEPKPNLDARVKKEATEDITEPTDPTKPHKFVWFDDKTEENRVGSALRSTTVKDVFAEHDFTSIGGRLAMYMPHIAKIVNSLVPNIPVRFVSAKELDRLRYDLNLKAGEKNIGFYDATQKQIVLVDGLSHGLQARAVLHEAIHAATLAHIEDNPVARAQIRKIMDDVLGKRPEYAKEYGLSNEHEFITESLTNKDFQELMMNHEISPELAKELGVAEWRNKPTAWKAIVARVRDMLKSPEKSTSALEAAMKAFDDSAGKETSLEGKLSERYWQDRPLDRTEHDREMLRVKASLPSDEAVERNRADTKADLVVKEEEASKESPREALNKRLSAPKMMFARVSSAIGEASHRMGIDPDRTVSKLVEAHALRAHMTQSGREKFDGIQKEWLDLVSKYKDQPEVMNNATRVLNESTVNGIDPSKPLTKKGQGYSMSGSKWWQRKARDAELRPVYDALPDDAKTVIASWRNLADESSHELGVETMVNQMTKFGVVRPEEARAMAERLWSNTDTLLDQQNLGDWYDTIKDAGDISRLQGPYSPLGRSGKHVVLGKIKAVLTGKETVHGDPKDKDFSFTSEADAKEFAEKQHLNPSVRTEIFNTKTGLDHDPETGTKFTSEDLKATDLHPDLAKQWIVGVNDQHMSMHHRLSDAENLERDMKASGKYEPDSIAVQEKEYHAPVNPTLMGNEYKRMEQRMEANDKFKRMSKAQQESARETLQQHFMQVLAATRAHSTRVARKNVAGYDTAPHDMLRNFDEYASEYGKRLGTLKTQPVVDAALENIKKQVDKKGEGGYALSKVYNEMLKREAALKDSGSSAYNLQPAIQRILSASYMMHLATPAFTIRNLTQPFMYTYPELAARYGFAKTTKFMLQAYNDIGAGKLLLEGIKGTGRAFKGDKTIQLRLMDSIMSRMGPEERELFEKHIAAKTLDADAGLQIGRTERRAGNPQLDIREGRLRDFAEGALGVGDRIFLRTEEIGRALPTAAEAINRAVTILASHRLEMAKSGDKEAAWARSMTTADQTQYRYTDEDKPAFMRHPLARPPLQFKMFGMRTWETIVRHVGNVISGQSPEERVISLKALAGLTVTHMAMAGALGLAWEPFRAALIGARQIGVTDKDWDDVESYFRDRAKAAGLNLGMSKEGASKFSEVFNRGLPRLLNADFSSGLGVDNMLLFSAPKAGQERDMDDNFKSWLFSQMFGSAGEMGINTLKGVRDAVHGDPLKAAQELIPFKAVSDMIRAWREGTEGKKTDRGRQTFTPYTPYEMGLRAAGIPVARESEQSAYAHQASQLRQKEQNRRSALTTAWITADTAAQKEAARQAAMDGGLKMKDLTSALKRQRDQQKRVVNGAVSDNRATSPVSKKALKELSGDYNLRSQ